jgi:hypothetical protein
VLLGDRGSRCRCLFVWVSGTATLAAPALLCHRQLARLGSLWADPASWQGTPFDRALQRLAAGVLLVCAGWAWVALSVTVGEAWRGLSPRPPRIVPDGVRRAVLAACGVALVTSVSGPALAAGGVPPRSGDVRHVELSGLGVLSGLPLPDRAVAPRRTPPPPSRTVVVRRGDCLWSIARHDLPPGATSAEVSARWRAVYAVNRHVIGPDPDVIEPGQRLRLPRKDPA